MRNRPYDVSARKWTVSLTLNEDLYAKEKGPGLNLSKAAEEEIRHDLAALNAFAEAHGSFAEMVREHYLQAERDHIGLG